ncbi:Cyclic di-GMP phosphodiesterase response regulator RpfG [Planctomycetes bacterium Pan216]|uniref:Cyclic di-GMP phosphodiesterase response regulator RpfG n=1 Tax=Kolteria novifilia TaxID=2527975 RepID=A0A518BB18_9BACT|nr:Cyclic di-GMP phosphodiesterase response regulator RpfG [Planctomycetes bacterium Pan216]
MASSGELQARIDQLRHRLRSWEERQQNESAGESIEDRLLEIRRRIEERQSESSAARRQRDARIDDAERVLEDSGAASPWPSEVLGRRRRRVLEGLNDRLCLLSRIAERQKEFGPAPPEQDRIHRHALRLAEMAGRALRGAEPETLETVLHDAEAIDQQLRQTCSELLEWSETELARQRQVEQIEAFHSAVVAGENPSVEPLRNLVTSIINDVEECQTAMPRFVPSKSTDRMVAEHSVNVARVVAFLAWNDSLWQPHRESIVMAALLQDVGMRRVPTEWLLQEGTLSSPQRVEIDRHPLVAAAFLAKLEGIDEEVVRAVLGHHERCDGTGYPHGKRAAELTQPALLLAVADDFVGRCALRPYRPRRTVRQAIAEVLAEAEAGRLDVAWTRKLLNLSLYPVGTLVELSNGAIAEVVATQEASEDPALAVKPVVRLRIDRSGKPVHLPRYWNLAVRGECRIVRELTPLEASEVLAAA